jgi:hypothetical protein
MHGSGDKERETIRPEFDRSIMIDFQGAKITSDTGFLLLREIESVSGFWVQSSVNLRMRGPGFIADTLCFR